MSNALKKINARVKVLQKKHPNAKRTTLQKQAGREYRTGTMPKKRKAPAKKKAAPRKKASRSLGTKYKIYHKVKKVGKVKRRKRAAPKKAARAKTRVRTKTVTKYRRVGGSGGSSKTLLGLAAVAGVGILAYMALRPKNISTSQTSPSTLLLTGNASRDNSAQNILAYATAAGLGISAITQLINALNNSNDATVVSAAQSPSTSINTLLALPTGGPSIHLG